MKWKVGDYLYDLGRYMKEYTGDIGIITELENDRVYVTWLVLVLQERKFWRKCETIEDLGAMDYKFVKMKESEVILELL